MRALTWSSTEVYYHIFVLPCRMISLRRRFCLSFCLFHIAFSFLTEALCRCTHGVHSFFQSLLNFYFSLQIRINSFNCVCKTFYYHCWYKFIKTWKSTLSQFNLCNQGKNNRANFRPSFGYSSNVWVHHLMIWLVTFSSIPFDSGGISNNAINICAILLSRVFVDGQLIEFLHIKIDLL